MDREEIFKENKDKLYGIVIGQCTPELKSTIKGDAEYEKKSSVFYTLWLLQKTNKATAGVGMKKNPDLTLYEEMIILLTKNQGHMESDDEYLSRFNSCLENMNLAVGAHVFCSPKIIGKELSQCITP